MTASKPELNHSNFTATPVSKKIPQRGRKARVERRKEQDRNEKVLKGNLVSQCKRGKKLRWFEWLALYLLIHWPPMALALVLVCNQTNDIMQFKVDVLFFLHVFFSYYFSDINNYLP